MDAQRAARVTRWKLEQAVKTAASGNEGAAGAKWAKAAREKQRKVRRVWNTLAVVAGSAYAASPSLLPARDERAFWHAQRDPV